MYATKITVWTLVFLALTSTAFASDWCYANTTCERFAEIRNSSVFFDADSATITIYDPQQNIIVNDQPMHKFDIGRFAYNYSFEKIGIHYEYVDFKNSTGGLIGQNGDSFSIRGGISNMLETILIILGLVLIGGIFIFVAIWSGNYIWYGFAGAWYWAMMFVATSVVQGINPWFNYLFFFTMGLLCILEASDIIGLTRDRRREV